MTMIIIVKFQLYARKVVVLAVSRVMCISCRRYVDVHVEGSISWGQGGGRWGLKIGFSCGRYKWMTPPPPKMLLQSKPVLYHGRPKGPSIYDVHTEEGRAQVDACERG